MSSHPTQRPFEFSAEDAKRYEQRCSAIEEEVDLVVNGKFRNIGAQLRLHVVKPFCQKFGLTFDSGMGSWSFRYRTGPRAGQCWFVGEERRMLPDRPDGPDGDADCWWPEITDEERAIHKVLDTPDYRGSCNLGSWVDDYPDSQGC